MIPVAMQSPSQRADQVIELSYFSSGLSTSSPLIDSPPHKVYASAARPSSLLAVATTSTISYRLSLTMIAKRTAIL